MIYLKRHTHISKYYHLLKYNLNYIRIIFFLLLSFLFNSCSTNEPALKDDKQLKWELMPELAEVDVRYIVKNDRNLFLAGVESSNEYSGLLYKTADGLNWELIKNFPAAVGPLTFKNDTLYILSDSLYMYTPASELKGICKYEGVINIEPHYFGDMIFLKGNLYLMKTAGDDYLKTYKLSFDGTFEVMKVLQNLDYGGAKFIKDPSKPDDIAYVRPYYYWPFFFYFDGMNFYLLADGLTEDEKKSSASNSMAFKEGLLYAGFKNPSSVKILTENIWQTYTDTLPRSKYADNFQPPLKTETTAIVFYKDRMFVSTNYLGVLEWTKNSQWVPISNGLIDLNEMKGLYDPIVFLEEFNDFLFAAYGMPAYAQWGGKGVYKINLKELR